MPDVTENTPVTLGQKIFDNVFLILALGIAFPGIFYFLWGLIEIFVFHNTQLSDYLMSSGQADLLSGGF
jgi:hypothetical protein